MKTKLNRLKEMHIHSQHSQKHDSQPDPFLSISHLMDCQRRVDALAQRNPEIKEQEEAKRRGAEERILEEERKREAEERVSTFTTGPRERRRPQASRKKDRKAIPEKGVSFKGGEERALDMDDLVQSQRDQQAQLTLEIMKMAQTLRENCLHSLNIVQDDNKLLDGLGEKTDDSINQLSKTSQNVAKQDRRSGWVSNVFTIALIFLFASFLMLHTLIRASSAVSFW